MEVRQAAWLPTDLHLAPEWEMGGSANRPLKPPALACPPHFLTLLSVEPNTPEQPQDHARCPPYVSGQSPHSSKLPMPCQGYFPYSTLFPQHGVLVHCVHFTPQQQQCQHQNPLFYQPYTSTRDASTASGRRGACSQRVPPPGSRGQAPAQGLINPFLE